MSETIVTNPTLKSNREESLTKPNPTSELPDKNLHKQLKYSKGLGTLVENAVGCKDWNILKEDVSLPAAVIQQTKLNHNLTWMQTFIDQYGVKFAPHGKTTMCPALFQKQIATGAWGISLATVAQVKVAHDFGINRVLMVNQLVGKRNMEIISELLTENFEFACIVDSVEIVDQLGKFFEEKGQTIRVLLEIGVEGGRTGLRNPNQEATVLQALTKWKKSIHLIGVELYESILNEEAGIRQFLKRAAERLKLLQGQGHFVEDPILITGAGSAWFDVVAEELTQEFRHPNWPPSTDSNPALTCPAIEIVLRPGCYLTSDIGSYQDAQNRMSSANSIVKSMGGPGLLPAFRIWAYVQSIPESDLAIVSFGKRDTGTDSGFPVPALHFRPTNAAGLPTQVPEHWIAQKVMDQHLFLKIKEGDDLRVGDMMAFDILHPCTNFDKWKTLLIVDDKYQVVEILETYF